MNNYEAIERKFEDKLGLRYKPVGLYYSELKPDDATGFKEDGGGCIMPLILLSAKGKTVAFNENTAGWNCSAFYLGFREWIFNGIEYFLSKGPYPGRECERFTASAKETKKYVESMRYPEKSKGYAIFKPLSKFKNDEKPEVVIFFANADQLSALTFLTYFDAPNEDDRVTARFASACASVSAIPLNYSRQGIKKAVWGMHDISARARLPKELSTFALPFDLFTEMYNNMDESFLITSAWTKILNRINKNIMVTE